MLKKVIFELESDILVCGVNTESNFLNSEDYISGAVLRAGFAKGIYLECDIKNRDNFIEIKNEEICCECSNYNVCKNFSNMKFSFLYKKDCIPAPLTTKKCKLKPSEHKIKDIMADNGAVECEDCKRHGGGRMEDAKGYINYKNRKVEAVRKHTFTHTAINYLTRTTLDGSLYSTRSIGKRQLFEGYIDDCESGLIEENTVVYVGKYSSNGMGKLRVKSVTPTEITKVTEDTIRQFTEMYGKKKDGKMYAPILLLSDARLGFKSDDTVKTTEEYKKIWNEKLFGNETIFNIENVYSQNRIYSGFDTNQKWGNWKKQPIIQTVRGSCFLLSFDKDKLTDAVAVLNKLKENGIGEDTYNGYGNVDVCSEIHMIGVNTDGNSKNKY